MKTIVNWMIFLFLFAGSFCACEGPSNKQIATCVQTCEGISAGANPAQFKRDDGRLVCVCARTYLVDPSGTQISEVTR